MSKDKKPPQLPLEKPKPSNEGWGRKISNDGKAPNVISQNRPAPPRPKPDD